MKRLIPIGIVILVCIYIAMLITFSMAYFNGYEVIVYINNYNEAHIEMIFLLLTIPIVAYTAYQTLK